MSSQTATELIKIVGARVAFKKRGTCKHILLHYACQSKESTQDLFEYFTKKQRQEAEHFYEEEEFVFKNELIDARALAEFLRLPASSLERVASQQLMIEKVNTKVVDRDNMLMLHFEGVAIVVLIATYILLPRFCRTRRLRLRRARRRKRQAGEFPGAVI